MARRRFYKRFASGIPQLVSQPVVKSGMSALTPDQVGTDAAFYQAVPVAKSANLAHGAYGVQVGGRQLAAHAWPRDYNPDGTVRLLAVEGVWPADLTGSRYNFDLTQPLPVGGEGVSVTQQGDQLLLSSGHTLAFLFSYVTVNKPQTFPTAPPHGDKDNLQPPSSAMVAYQTYLNFRGRNEWDKALTDASTATPVALTPRIRTVTTLRENGVYKITRVRGDGGAAGVGANLEWQLDLKIYKHTGEIKLAFTRVPHWNPELYALTKQELVITSPTPWTNATVGNNFVTHDLTTPLTIKAKTSAGGGDVAANYNRCQVIKGATVAQTGTPGSNFESLVLDGPNPLSVAAPRFSWKRPNHIKVDGPVLTLAPWSNLDNAVYDTRLTLDTVNEYDVSATHDLEGAYGSAHTARFNLYLGSSVPLALHNADRRDIWFAPGADWTDRGYFPGVKTSTVIKPENDDYWCKLLGIVELQRQAAQEVWMFTGQANFGAMPAEYTQETDDIGHFVFHTFPHYGRYGWRKGAMGAYGLSQLALSRNEREMLMMAVDKAEYQTGTPMGIIPWFQPKYDSELGGSTKRNRDHWSGHRSAQYQEWNHVYFMSWLCGYDWYDVVLDDATEFLSLKTGADVVHRYWNMAFQIRQTPPGPAKDTLIADAHAEVMRIGDHWQSQGSPPGGFPSPANTMWSNFRINLNFRPALLEMYFATGRQSYLDNLAQSFLAHGLQSGYAYRLDGSGELCYLLQNGYTATDVGQANIDLLYTDGYHGTKKLRSQPTLGPKTADRPWTYSYLNDRTRYTDDLYTGIACGEALIVFSYMFP